MSRSRRSSRKNSKPVTSAAPVPAQGGSVRPSASVSVSLPYDIRKQTVIFGGHTAWLKTLRPMLQGNVRFIDWDRRFSLNLIRNADIVWIQTNSLSHAMYVRIADSARQYHKPVRYFSCAGAVGCARQVLEADA